MGTTGQDECGGECGRSESHVEYGQLGRMVMILDNNWHKSQRNTMSMTQIMRKLWTTGDNLVGGGGHYIYLSQTVIHILPTSYECNNTSIHIVGKGQNCVK